MATDLSVLDSYAAQLKSGAANLAERLLRRLITAQGSLFYQPDYGFDLRRQIGSRMDQAALYATAQGVRQQLLADVAVTDVQVTASFRSRLLTVTASVSSSHGDFGLQVSAGRQAVTGDTNPGTVLYSDSFILGVLL